MLDASFAVALGGRASGSSRTLGGGQPGVGPDVVTGPDLRAKFNDLRPIGQLLARVQVVRYSPLPAERRRAFSSATRPSRGAWVRLGRALKPLFEPGPGDEQEARTATSWVETRTNALNCSDDSRR